MSAHFLRLVRLVAVRDYVRTVKRRGFLLGTLLLPLGVVVILGISSLAAVVTVPLGGDALAQTFTRKSSMSKTNRSHSAAMLAGKYARSLISILSDAGRQKARALET